MAAGLKSGATVPLVADALLLSELIDQLQSKHRDLPPKAAATAVRRVLAEISPLADGRRVELRGFGSFDLREREAG